MPGNQREEPRPPGADCMSKIVFHVKIFMFFDASTRQGYFSKQEYNMGLRRMNITHFMILRAASCLPPPGDFLLS